MRLYTTFTPSHKILYDNYFIKTLPDEFDLHIVEDQEQSCPTGSFYQEGWTIAVDFSYHEFDKTSIKKFYKELSRCGGKIYLAKDSSLDEENFKLMYPEYYEWEKIVKEIDPKNLYQSYLSKRLGLKKW